VSCTGNFNDLHVFNISALAWSDLSDPAAGIPPSPRAGHGFKAVEELLYVHGGISNSGKLYNIISGGE